MDYWDQLTGTEARACVRIGGAKCDDYKTLTKFMSAAKLGRRPAQCAMTGRGRGVGREGEGERR